MQKKIACKLQAIYITVPEFFANQQLKLHMGKPIRTKTIIHVAINKSKLISTVTIPPFCACKV
jgi:hypothetical protein